MLERLGDWLVWASILIYLLATVAYWLGKRPWDAVYWVGCALINYAVLMLRQRQH